MSGSATASFAPDAPGINLDPYPIFADLRENDPLHRSDLGYWVVSRHEDVRSVLMDREAFGQGDFEENIRLFYGPDFDVIGPAFLQVAFRSLPYAGPAATYSRQGHGYGRPECAAGEGDGATNPRDSRCPH